MPETLSELYLYRLLNYLEENLNGNEFHEILREIGISYEEFHEITSL